MSANPFASKKAVASETVEEDFIGGNGTISTDIYAGKLKMMYLTVSKKGATACNLVMSLMVGGKAQERTFQIYTTNKDGDVTYKKEGEVHNLPGFQQVNGMCMTLLSKQLGELETEDRTVKIYDFEQKKEIPQSVPTFPELEDLEISVAVQEQEDDINDLVDGSYVPTGKTRKQNEIIKIFSPHLNVTLSEVAQFIQSLGGTFDAVLGDGQLVDAYKKMAEAENSDELCAYANKWLEKNRGECYDKSKGKGAKGSGKSFGGGSGSGGGEKKEKPSLF